MAKLGEVCTIVSGSTPKTSVTSYWDGNIKWITPAELNEDTFYIMDSVRHITEEGKEKTGLSYMPTGTVILSSRAPIGKTAIAGCKMCCNQGFKNLICSDAIYNEYLYFFLKSKTDYLNSLGRGATFKEISKSIVESIEIPLPEVNQQKEIAEKFKKLEQLISLRKQQLAKLDELVKARFVEMFLLHDYPTKTLDELSIEKGEYGAQSASTEYDSTRPRYIRITDVNEDGTLNDDKVSSENITDDEQYRLSYGDFMFARMGATVGKTYAFLSGNQIFAGYLIRYKLNLSLANPRYLFWYTKLDDYQKWVKLNQSGAAQPGINAKKYGSLKIPVPPIAHQNQFAAFVERVDQQKQTVQQSLEKLELMKKALMQEYFG